MTEKEQDRLDEVLEWLIDEREQYTGKQFDLFHDTLRFELSVVFPGEERPRKVMKNSYKFRLNKKQYVNIQYFDNKTHIAIYAIVHCGKGPKYALN